MSKARKPLGKGLGNLLDTSADALVAKADAGITELPVDRVRASERNPRKKFDKTAIEELARTISAHGLLQPILVVNQGEYYEVISGERRLRAVRSLNLPTIPAIIKNISARDTMEVALIENIQREQLDPLEEAAVYRSLIDEHQMTQEELANRVGKNRATIANRMRLLSLPELVQAMVADGRLTEGQVRPLLALKNESRIIRLAMDAEKHSYSARQIEEIVRNDRPAAADRRKPRPDPETRAFEKELEEALGTKVKVEFSKKAGNGRLIVHFYSLEDLDRISALLK